MKEGEREREGKKKER
jgi:hypothetical protein